MTPSTLLLHKLKSGDVLILQATKEVPAIAWAATERLQDNIIQISRTLQICCNLGLGDRVSIKKATQSVEDVKSVLISYAKPISNAEIPLWKPLFEEILGKLDLRFLTLSNVLQAKRCCYVRA